MSTLASYLRRFRRLVSPPGRPARAAVPADRLEQLSDELRDVFAAVDVIRQDADRTREDAVERARRRRLDGQQEVTRILEQARETAEEERASAAASHLDQITADIRSSLDAAEGEASGIRARACDRVDGLADQIVRQILRSGSDDLEATG